FIALDPPAHDQQRRVIAPMFAHESLKVLEPLIRTRAAKILDELPRGETFDFVDKVAVELTSQMLATLFDFPFEERRLLPRASDLILTQPGPGGIVETEEQRQVEFFQIFAKFTALWDERLARPPQHDLISMLCHNEATRKDSPEKYLGNIILLIVAGSDTTRHSITGGLLALNQYPEQYDKLRANPALIESMVPEIIRWQSPVAHMRRTALADAEIGGKRIKKGEKVIMWYVSGNRDEDAIDRPLAIDDELVRPVDRVLVAVARDVPHDDLLALFDPLAADLGVGERGAAHMRDRALPADDLRHHALDQRRIGAQLVVLFRILVQRQQPAGDRVPRRVAAGHDQQDDVAEIFLRRILPRRLVVAEHGDQVVLRRLGQPLVPQRRELGENLEELDLALLLGLDDAARPRLGEDQVRSEIRSCCGGLASRSSHSAVNLAKIWKNSTWRCSSVSTMPPGPGWVRIRSDLRSGRAAAAWPAARPTAP